MAPCQLSGHVLRGDRHVFGARLKTFIIVYLGNAMDPAQAVRACAMLHASKAIHTPYAATDPLSDYPEIFGFDPRCPLSVRGRAWCSSSGLALAIFVLAASVEETKAQVFIQGLNQGNNFVDTTGHTYSASTQTIIRATGATATYSGQDISGATLATANAFLAAQAQNGGHITFTGTTSFAVTEHQTVHTDSQPKGRIPRSQPGLSFYRPRARTPLVSTQPGRDQASRSGKQRSIRSAPTRTA